MYKLYDTTTSFRVTRVLKISGASTYFVVYWSLVSVRWVNVRQAEPNDFKPYHTVATTPLLAICASRVSSVALVRRASAAIIRSCISVTALHASKSSV